MNCREMEYRIALQVSGDLDPGQERLVEDHLAACERCTSLATGLRSDLDDLRALRAEPLDEGALAALRLSVVEQLESRRARTLSPVAWILASSNVRWAAAAAVILLVVISGLRHADYTDTPDRRIELPVKSALPLASEKPVPIVVPKNQPRPQPRAETVHTASNRAVPLAKPNRYGAQARERPSPREDHPLANNVEIVDSNANSGLSSPPATLVQLQSSDPNVVLYWLVESNGG